ncbi:TonB-dependent receptor [Rapidithrix thailandica]|uniref:TonB-dependent receptor n=1 Tax=Rapidithrix thailandica TaxID=413964 RepID=A0AAW9S6A2_9BACT
MRMKNLYQFHRWYIHWVQRMLLSCLLCCLVTSAWAQEVQISGQVVSADDSQPLLGASIRVKGTANGSVTDMDGSFKLNVPQGAILVFSYIGYLNQEIEVRDQSFLKVALEADVQVLNSVVVVGYGTQKKESLTGSIATMELTTKENQPITNISNALQGMPGLHVNLSNSMPGVDRARIRIRGVGTLNNSDPLVLVDGIEYPMDELNPDDIASISVLKDASAAIYGSRAANGVILVTTKKGNDRSQVNYNYYFGVQKPTTLPDAIWDPIAYMKLKNEAALNSGKTKPQYSDAQIQEYEEGMSSDPYLYPASNWFDIALENGYVQKHNLSVSGGSDKFKYRLALGYLDREGVIIGPNNHEKKYSIGLNTSAKVNKKLEVGLTLNGYYRYYTQPSYTNGSFWKYLMRTLPIMPDRLEDGSYGYTWLRTSGRNNWEHPTMIAKEGSYKKDVQRFLSTVYANYKLPLDINYHVKFGIDKYDGYLKRFIPQMVKKQSKTGQLYNWNNPATAPRVYNNDYNDLNIHFYNTLQWQKVIAEKHDLSLMLGASYDKFGNSSFGAQMTGYLDASLTALDAGTERLDIFGNSTKDVLMSYFGRLNYMFDEKYLLEAAFRYDGSSRFAPGNRWGFFPSLSAGWRLDKEAFLEGVSVIDLLKLRASVGILGNQAVPLYSYENSITLGHNYSFGGQLASGAAATAYADPSISWETTTTYNIGVDLDLWESKLSITADYYKKRTEGILRTVNLPAQVGNLSGPKQNVGVVDNSGYELTAQYRNQLGPLQYTLRGNMAYNENEVVDLDGQILYSDGTNLPTITQEGYPMNSYFVLDAIGIFQSDDEVANHAYQSKNTRAGYIKYRDVNEDGIINGDDRVLVNSSSVMPKYTYGFGVNLEYKGVSLSADFQGVGGVKIYPTANLAFPFNNGANATWDWVHDSWTPDRPNASLPIVTESTGKRDNFQNSDFWLRDGSYLRLKNIQLSYNLPSAWLAKLKIQRMSVFVNAQNWLTFTKYKDFDPESVLNASTLYHYPMLKTFSTGANITL